MTLTNWQMSRKSRIDRKLTWIVLIWRVADRLSSGNICLGWNPSCFLTQLVRQSEAARRMSFLHLACKFCCSTCSEQALKALRGNCPLRCQHASIPTLSSETNTFQTDRRSAGPDWFWISGQDASQRESTRLKVWVPFFRKFLPRSVHCYDTLQTD